MYIGSVLWRHTHHQAASPSQQSTSESWGRKLAPLCRGPSKFEIKACHVLLGASWGHAHGPWGWGQKSDGREGGKRQKQRGAQEKKVANRKYCAGGSVCFMAACYSCTHLNLAKCLQYLSAMSSVSSAIVKCAESHPWLQPLICWRANQHIFHFRIEAPFFWCLNSSCRGKI